MLGLSLINNIKNSTFLKEVKDFTHILSMIKQKSWLLTGSIYLLYNLIVPIILLSLPISNKIAGSLIGSNLAFGNIMLTIFLSVLCVYKNKKNGIADVQLFHSLDENNFYNNDAIKLSSKKSKELSKEAIYILEFLKDKNLDLNDNVNLVYML